MNYKDGQYDLEQQLQDIRISREIDNIRDELQASASVGATITGDDETSLSQIPAINYLDNSDLAYSKFDALTGVGAPDDTAEEAYNFYRERLIKLTDVSTANGSATIESLSNPFNSAYSYPMRYVLYAGGASGATLYGELTRVDDAHATLDAPVAASLTNATLWLSDAVDETRAVKSSGHSTFAANEGANPNIPRWAKDSGWLEFGSNVPEKYAISTPLPINLINPNLSAVYVKFILSRRDGDFANPVTIFAGLWDATADQQRWIEGGAFQLSGVVSGVAGSRTLQYKLIAAYTDGSTVESNVLTVSSAPDALSAANYVELSWTGATALDKVYIYRYDGSYKRVFTVENGATSFRDTGIDDGATFSQFPASAGGSKSIAYAERSNVTISDDWVLVSIRLAIPQDYNQSLTTGRQFLRVGVLTDTPAERAIEIDKFMLSFQSGGWNLSARDLSLTKSPVPSSLPSEGSQGDSGVYNPNPRCLTLDCPIVVLEDGLMRKPIAQIKVGDTVLGGSWYGQKVTHIKRGTVDKIVSVTLSNGIGFKCSLSERVVTSRADKKGTLISALTFGDEILTNADGRSERATIEGYKIERGSFEVATLTLEKGHIFQGGYLPENIKIGGALFHNRKADELEQYQLVQ